MKDRAAAEDDGQGEPQLRRARGRRVGTRHRDREERERERCRPGGTSPFTRGFGAQVGGMRGLGRVQCVARVRERRGQRVVRGFSSDAGGAGCEAHLGGLDPGDGAEQPLDAGRTAGAAHPLDAVALGSEGGHASAGPGAGPVTAAV